MELSCRTAVISLQITPYRKIYIGYCVAVRKFVCLIAFAAWPAAMQQKRQVSKPGDSPGVFQSFTHTQFLKRLSVSK